MQGDVFLLQEVHLRDEEDVSAFTREWVWGPSEWSVGGVHSDGVGILFRGFSFVIDEVVGFITGRVIFVDFTFMSVKYRIVNVYAPAQGGRRLEVFRELPGCLSTSRSLILGGDFNVSLDGGRGGAWAGEGGMDYSVMALEGVVGDFSLADAFRTVHPGDVGYTWRNSRGKASRLDYIFVGGGICGMKCVLLPSWASDHDMLQVSLPTDGPKWGSGFWRLNTLLLEADAFKAAFTSLYRSVRTMKSMYVSVVEWWEAAKCRFAIFCRRFAATARRRDRAGVTKWTSSLSYLHGCLNRGEYVDWALYEGAKERLRGLLEARAKALAFQARLRELEEGEKPSAYFFQAARARRSAPAFVGLKRADGTVAEGSAMLAVAEAYYAELFSRRACDPVVEAALLDCVSARLESEEAQSMEADVSLEEVRRRCCPYGTAGRPGTMGACDSAALNWEARLNLVRTRLGVWTRRQLSLTGRVVVVRSVLMPLLIHLAYVFPVPARTKLALTRLVFRFLWGGRYEYVTREPSPVYRSVMRFLRQCPSPVTREEATDHRALYARLASRQVVTPSGVPAGVVWSRVSGGGAPGAVRDLQWRCALGRLPVREILHRHGCAASPLCPRGCGAPETVSHVFWDCPFAGEFWTLVLGLLRRVGPGLVLSRDGVVYRRGLGLLPSVTSGVLWDVLGYAKWALWDDRVSVVGESPDAVARVLLVPQEGGRADPDG
ncbi:hypothetical protein AAFF_G00091360 [Aldrovandia affinis]|uniref:Reverse transcriptase zinc-binding domain-containing protein n=1 Tax=Aldrovandia affinis TaxID=143900 RepID=A0AAD7VXJ4_9TELE|nr:hypothetical protein AAFF_G00091360 [Aldrovandia affinis]